MAGDFKLARRKQAAFVVAVFRTAFGPEVAQIQTHVLHLFVEQAQDDLGAEGEGLHELLRKKSDALVHLPMLGKVSSLNAAVAGSILLYEIVRQRR